MSILIPIHFFYLTYIFGLLVSPAASASGSSTDHGTVPPPTGPGSTVASRGGPASPWADGGLAGFLNDQPSSTSRSSTITGPTRLITNSVFLIKNIYRYI